MSDTITQDDIVIPKIQERKCDFANITELRERSVLEMY